MLFLAKLCGILTLIWFYMTAKNHGGPLLNWPVIGLIGYWLTWWLSKMLIVVPLAGMVPKHSVVEFLLTQLPVLCSLAVCYLIRGKLIASLSAVDK
ncbi:MULTISPECIES: hypothetical protein [Methylomonas]|uniref:Uncharacterized protein n=1 Tax=Methylomonas koyamae TaxID=702114 RepID=A0A177N137_9GAMM|nr:MULTISPECIES: hypothetical protein [Methylomonas]NJA07842.1 hypothetical protein [Methylococcaceae bacterium WWC4]OAI11571.1 hypothetical protein A1355_15860 [Methylomonas koyamae]OHX37687.1 hypothetical protein BJL95_18185 [Methylomonas sp. LWB]